MCILYMTNRKCENVSQIKVKNLNCSLVSTPTFLDKSLFLWLNGKSDKILPTLPSLTKL